MPTNTYRTVLLAVAMLSGSVNLASASDGCCTHCGHHGACQKVCRLVAEEKKVEIVCFGCKCEHFCLPGPSQPGCRHCQEVCGTCGDNCDCTVPQAAPKKFVWTEWIPGCAQVHTKKKLMKKVVTEKVPSYKWVVEDLCPKCDKNCVGAEIHAGAEVPAPPVVAAKLKYSRAMAGRAAASEE